MTYANVKTDTVILGVNCKKIEREVFIKTRYSDDPDNILISSRPQKDLYVYDNAETVFVYNENFNRFTPLYIFNVNEGDTVMFARPGRRPQT